MSHQSIPCHYFPELFARWSCTRCDRNFSSACLKEKQDYEEENHCPICWVQYKKVTI